MQLDPLYAMDAFLGYPVFRGKACKTVQRILLEEKKYFYRFYDRKEEDFSSSTFQSQAVWSIFLASF